MRTAIALTITVLLAAMPDFVLAETPRERAPVTRVAFGSCIKQDRPVPILDTIATERPEVFLLTGDNIYADTEDMVVMRRKYQTLAQLPSFARLKRSCRILATWDDHDFGVNDGGADYPKRKESQTAFLDFMEIPSGSPRRSQDGVYSAEVFGPPGKRLQVILLDTRYFRSPLKKGDRRVGGPYYPDDDEGKTMLGEEQWKWLEKQLVVPADIRLIVSSIQFAPSAAGQECWANLPHQRERMLKLIETTSADGIVFISGDRHWSEVSAIKNETPYPIYDITCSSLNQLHERGTPTENRFRVSKPTFHKENYGMLTIHWSDDPKMAFSIRDKKGATVIQQNLRLSQISK